MQRKLLDRAALVRLVASMRTRRSAVRRANPHQDGGRENQKPVEERAESDIGEVVPAIGDTLDTHDEREEQRYPDHRGARGRRGQQCRGEGPGGGRCLAGHEGAVGDALAAKVAEPPKFPWPAEFLRLEGPRAVRMLFDEDVDEKPRAERQRDRQKCEVTPGGNEAFARIKSRADVSEHEGAENREGRETQDGAKGAAEERGAVKCMMPLVKCVCHREIELRERKLANSGFVAKAPAEVVQKARDELGSLRAELRELG